MWMEALSQDITLLPVQMVFVSFMIMGEDGENGSMTVTDGVERKITLKEGDLIGIINTESEDSSLMLTAR